MICWIYWRPPYPILVRKLNVNANNICNAFQCVRLVDHSIIKENMICWLCASFCLLLQIFHFSKRWLGITITSAVVKPLFYRQFTAGNTSQEIIGIMQKLSSHGISSIIAIALEACERCVKILLIHHGFYFQFGFVCLHLIQDLWFK